MHALSKRIGDTAVRGQAAWALGEIGDPAARRALERAQLRDPAVEVQTAAEWALSRVPVQPVASAGWATRWAPVVSRLQPVRWLVLALSLVGAAWLMMGTRSLSEYRCVCDADIGRLYAGPAEALLPVQRTGDHRLREGGDMMQQVSYPLKNAIQGAVRPGRLHWVGPCLPNLPLGQQDLWREMRPRKFRWGLALILAIVLFLLMGECGPTASLVAVLP